MLLPVLPFLLVLGTFAQQFGQNANWYYGFNEDTSTFSPGTVTLDAANGGLFITGTANVGSNTKRIAVVYVMTTDGERIASFREETVTDYFVEHVTAEPSLAKLYYVSQAKPQQGVTIPDKFYVRICDLMFPEENGCILSDNSQTQEMIDSFITMKVHPSGAMVIASITTSINGQVCSDSQGYLRRYDKNGQLMWRYNRPAAAGSMFEFLTVDSGFIGFSNATNSFLVKFNNQTETFVSDVGDVKFNCVAQNPIVGVLVDKDRAVIYAYGTSIADSFRNINTTSLFGATKGAYYFISKFSLEGGHIKTKLFDSSRNTTGVSEDDALVSAVLDPATGDILLAGNTKGTFVGTFKSGQDKDIFLMRFNSNLDMTEVNRFGNNVDDTVGSIAIDRTRNVLYVFGKSSSAFGMNFTSPKVFIAAVPLNSNQTATATVSSSLTPTTAMSSNHTVRPSSLYHVRPVLEDLGSLVKFIKKYSPPSSTSSAKATATRSRIVATTSNRPNDDLSKFLYSIMDPASADVVVQYIAYILLAIGLVVVLILSCCFRCIYTRFYKSEKKAGQESMNAFEIYQRQNNIQVKDLSPTSRIRREDTMGMNRKGDAKVTSAIPPGSSSDRYRISAVPSTGSLNRSTSKALIASDTALTRSDASIGMPPASNSQFAVTNTSSNSMSRLNGVPIGSSPSTLVKPIGGYQSTNTSSQNPLNTMNNGQSLSRQSTFSNNGQTIARQPVPNAQPLSRQSTMSTSASRSSPLQKSNSKSKLSDLDDLTNSLSSFK